MMYSVFDWERGLYHYFEAPGDKLGVRPKPSASVNDENGKGHQLEKLLPVLPKDAHATGTGREAKGRVVAFSDAVRNAMNKEPTPLAVQTSSVSTLLGLNADPSSSNPLVSSPWLTLGLWVGAVLVGFRAANGFGKWLAR